MYEKITFTNGISDYFYTSDLHQINFICELHGLNVNEYHEFNIAFDILRKKQIY